MLKVNFLKPPKHNLNTTLTLKPLFHLVTTFTLSLLLLLIVFQVFLGRFLFHFLYLGYHKVDFSCENILLVLFKIYGLLGYLIVVIFVICFVIRILWFV